MSCKMKSDVLFDATCFRYVFKILVHLLITEDGKDVSFLADTFVPFDQFHWNVKYRYIDLRISFMTMCHNPLIAVKGCADIVCAQFLDVDVGKPGVAGEDEDVAYLFKSLCGELLFYDCSQFFFGEVATVNPFESDFVAAEWISFYISIVTRSRIIILKVSSP